MRRIEEYALLGDCRGAALVGIDGSIDWACIPRFDSEACFAALLGSEDNGFWKIAPATPTTAARRSYRDGTLTIETELTCAEGRILLTDFMPVGGDGPGLVRIVSGIEGEVPMCSELALRFNYGKTVPWVTRKDGAVEAVAGPDLVRVWASVPMHGENLRTVADFVVRPGERAHFVLRWSPSYASHPIPTLDPEAALARCDAIWQEWSSRCALDGPHAAIVKRSLITLKALTFAPTGGIVAAATSSLPELIGGVRNWDYRFCWLRDATFTLYALLRAGYLEEARAWRDWLLRAAAGAPDQLQILYGIAGERRLTEVELPWLSGYEGSAPVRVGNLASEQTQLDVYGEVAATLYEARLGGLAATPNEAGWALERQLLLHLEKAWREPDHGIWEVRGPKRHFVHSKVMCWVAFDRAVKSIERWGFEGPLDRWRAVRDEIHAEVCAQGYNPQTGGFAQYYGANDPDASLLFLPIVGFLPPTDPRIIRTVLDVERRLLSGGFVARYVTRPGVDGLPPGEGAFLACSFWYVDVLTLLGRHEEARAHFDRLMALVNDVGLLAEEYDPAAKRMLGNFPQALSHVALVHSAVNLAAL
ncbi:MAG: glycoside hydrolase family 15 protein [Labilithrix sp.]|nr:glycoside hydrolase family 15 protein [Labilithrix sp.]MCW5813481.1 glycoside hydrolase family 15 protein [Labilithrix sp.]